jgi:hypothetical protein
MDIEHIETLEDAEKFARRHFYPEWDLERQWVFKRVPPEVIKQRMFEIEGPQDSIPDGYTDHGRKEILIREGVQQGGPLTHMTVHETAHAASGLSEREGEKFAEELRKVECRANKLSLSELANLLGIDAQRAAIRGLKQSKGKDSER